MTTIQVGQHHLKHAVLDTPRNIRSEQVIEVIVGREGPFDGNCELQLLKMCTKIVAERIGIYFIS